MKTIRKSILVLFALSIALSRVMAIDCLSLEEAGKRGLVKLVIKSKGGCTGQVIEMKIKNLGHQLLNLKLEAGRRLDSKNDSQQDILVTKSEEFAVSNNEDKTLHVYGMCCQAHNSGPTNNSEYSIGRMADSNLVKLAEFIDKNKYFSSCASQHAIWAISDGNSIGGISGDNKYESDKLKKYVSKLTGRPIPKYNVDYAIEGSDETMGRARKIEGTFEYTLPANAHVSLAIYDSTGTLVQTLFKEEAHQSGDYKLYYTFRTAHLDQGTYYARLKMDGMTQKEMKIEF